MARPSKYSEEVANLICNQVREGKGLKSICQDSKLPAYSNVRRWITENLNGFQDLYARAKDDALWNMADEIQDIADSTLRAVSSEEIQSAKLRVDTRKWLLVKLKPREFGNRIEVEQKSPVDKIQIEIIKNDTKP